MNEPKQNDLVIVLTLEQAKFLYAILQDATIKGRHARMLHAVEDAIAGAKSFAQLMRPPVPQSPRPNLGPIPLAEMKG